MIESSDQVKLAVLCLGKYISIEHETEVLIKAIGLHSTIKTLIFKAFTENVNDYFIEDTKVFDSIQIIRKYCKEMGINGEKI